DGRASLRHDKLSELLQATLPLGTDGRPSRAHCKRVLSAAGVLCAVATSEHARRGNHVAQIDAWMLYLGHVIAVSERWNLPEATWKAQFEIARTTSRNLLRDLVEELKAREHLIEGSPICDSFFRPVRITRLVAMVSVFALWERQESCGEEVLEFAQTFCGKH